MPEASESSRRSKLAQWGLGYEKQETTVASLSGGERARLLLNQVAMDAPHVLILDEPTNHLDVDAREALAQALNAYEGAVVIVSHDRHMIELAADRTPDICQSQSVNIFLPGDVDKWDLHMLHWSAWEQGCKSLYYLRSKSVQRAAHAGAEAVASIALVEEGRTDYEECLACQ
jgi:energy-coupling factor transporter ATP-binding protein EcfA2